MDTPTRIKELRQASGLTSAELARRAGMGRQTLSRIETGQRGLTRRFAAPLAAALGVPVQELYAPVGSTIPGQELSKMQAAPIAPHGFADVQTVFPHGAIGDSRGGWPLVPPPWEKTVAAIDLPAMIGAVMAQVREGFSFLITDQGKVVARIDPEPLPPAKRFGLMAGQFEVPDDFDEWPEDIRDILEGRTSEG
jgi:transcriptional regulator with XRE-family HTH domain/antitoxin (DNA-binding transcriptional repressor) of toxin-antitoxin stability system